jgi:hypothetical protein
MTAPGFTAEASLRLVQPQQFHPPPPHPLPPCTSALTWCLGGSAPACNDFFSDCIPPWSGPAPGGPLCTAACNAMLAGYPAPESYCMNCHASGPMGGNNSGGGIGSGKGKQVAVNI